MDGLSGLNWAFQAIESEWQVSYLSVQKTLNGLNLRYSSIQIRIAHKFGTEPSTFMSHKLWPFKVLFFGPSALDLLILSFKNCISALYFASLPNPDVHRTDVLLDHNLPKNFYEKGSNAKRNHAIMRVLWLPPEKILVIIARFQIWNLNFFWMKNPNWLVNNNWVRMKSVGQVKVLLLFFDCNISFWLLWNQFNTYRN